MWACCERAGRRPLRDGFVWSGSVRCCAALLGVWIALMPVVAHTSSDSSATLSCLSFNLLHGGVSSGLWAAVRISNAAWSW